jgi:hypothetical protein
MAYQLDLEKGFLEIGLGNITSNAFIEETNSFSKELKNLRPIILEKFKIMVKRIDFQKILEPILFHLLGYLTIFVRVINRKSKFIKLLRNCDFYSFRSCILVVKYRKLGLIYSVGV